MSFASFHTASSSPSKFFHEAPRAGRGPWQYPCIPAPKIEEKTLTTANFPLEKNVRRPTFVPLPGSSPPISQQQCPKSRLPRPPAPPDGQTSATEEAHLCSPAGTPAPPREHTCADTRPGAPGLPLRQSTTRPWPRSTGGNPPAEKRQGKGGSRLGYFNKIPQYAHAHSQEK